MIGLNTGIDIDTIYPLIKDAKTILEFGAGYGRVINFLRKKGFANEYIGIERIDSLVKYLHENYPNEATILHQDIREIEIENHPNVILWLWSGILELTPEEQKSTIQEAYDLLAPNGLLIIEAPFKKIYKVGALEGEKSVRVEMDWGVLNAYFVTTDDIESYASSIGFSNFEYKTYQTTTDLERVFYLLRK